MTYSTWKLRKNGLKRIGINFVPASFLFNADTLRITNGAKEATLNNNPENYTLLNNNNEFFKYSIEDALSKNSSKKYNKLYKSFIKEYLIEKNNEEYSYTLLIKGLINPTYTENCLAIGTTCTDGDDRECQPGKCFGGNLTLTKVENNSSIIKATIERYSINKEFYINNKFFQSKEEEISDYYFSIFDDKEKLIYSSDKDKNFYRSIQGKIKLPLQFIFEINGYPSFISEFLDSILIFLFRKTCSGPIERCIEQRLLINSDIELFKEEIIKRISLKNFSDFIKINAINQINALNITSNLEEYVIACYSILENLFNSITYQVSSGFSLSKKEEFRGDLRGRPVYSRLPSSNFGYNISALEEDIIFVEDLNLRFNLSNIDSGKLVVLNDRSKGYKYTPRIISSYEERIKFGLSRNITDLYDKEQIFTPKDPKSWTELINEELPPIPVTEWVIEGIDSLLIESKEKIDRFFDEYLNPDTCFSDSLDWLAQHIGLNSKIYRTNYPDKIKRILIKNALGWFESDLNFQVKFPNGEIKIYKTIKGSVLDEEPFNNFQWSETTQTENIIIKSNILEGLRIDNELISKRDSNNKVIFEKSINPEVRKLINSDGSLLELDLSLSDSYNYTLVRFYGEFLPSFLSKTEKYFLKKIENNRYEIFSEFGLKLNIDEYIPNTDIFVENLFKVDISDYNNLIYDKNLWEGIYKSRGNKLGLAFALSLPISKTGEFVHNHVLEELKSDSDGKVFSVKSGLRINEIEEISPLLRPWERDYLQVGDECYNFSNQLIADISEVKEENSSYDLIFRLPFYYNRNGKTWNHVSNIKENWLPASVYSRIQYPYLASELWSVGDAFFELEIDG